MRSLEANAPSGRYELRIATQRAATPRDATVAAASAAYGEALLSGPAKTVEASRTLVEKLEKAAALFRDAEESGREADVCQSLGDAHVRAGDDKKAIEWFEREARLRHDRGDRRGEGSALNRMGVVYSRLGDATKALDSHSRALPLHRAAENRRGEATTLRYIGIEHFQSDPQKAIEPWQQARAIFKALQDDREEASTII